MPQQKKTCPNDICEWGFCLFIRKNTQTMDCFISWPCTALKSTLTGIIPIIAETSTSKFLNIVYPKWYHWEFDRRISVLYRWSCFSDFLSEIKFQFSFCESQVTHRGNTDNFFLNDLSYQIKKKHVQLAREVNLLQPERLFYFYIYTM